MNSFLNQVWQVLTRVALMAAMGAGGNGQGETGRLMEFLGRGLVAVRCPDQSVFLSWRFLGTDPDGVEFEVFRRNNSTDEVQCLGKVTGEEACVFQDREAGPPGSWEYAVWRSKKEGERAVLPSEGGIRQKEALTDAEWVSIWEKGYWEIPLQTPAGYRPGDASVGDLDGDGTYEIVVHQSQGGKDNSFAGVTGRPILEAYRLDGKMLWRIDLGRNIREGEHYTQFMVYDLDGDGKAEVVCKTADGTRDGVGTVLGDGDRDWRVLEEGSRLLGRILEGPEYLTVFDGETGRALQTVDYLPGRDPIDGWGGIGGNGKNDSYGNRCDRFLACVAYLDGDLPSVVMCRGVYGRIVLAAWDWRAGALTLRWKFDSGIAYPPFDQASPYSGMGGHSLGVADVDGDGKDEIVYQAIVVDDDGTGLHTSGLRHGDSMHVTDMDPERPGLEVFTVQENEDETVRFMTPGVALRDAWTGEILWSHSPGIDVGGGLAADVDPRYPGYEVWGGPGGMRNIRGEEIGEKPRNTSWAVWWDGDLLREFYGRSGVEKWNWKRETTDILQVFNGRSGPRGPHLSADLLGDWREEIVLSSADGSSLRIFASTHRTQHRLRTLMHDPQYRLAVAWQNVVYNKPPHPGFFLGEAMKTPGVGGVRWQKRP